MRKGLDSYLIQRPWIIALYRRGVRGQAATQILTLTVKLAVDLSCYLKNKNYDLFMFSKYTKLTKSQAL